MSDEPDMTAGDPWLEALAEMRHYTAEMRANTAAIVWALEGLRANLQTTITELEQLRAALGLPRPADMNALNVAERKVVAALAAAWRDSQPDAARTIPIAHYAQYSQRQTLRYLKALAERGIVCRDSRVGWLPLNAKKSG
jgi:DNA-binding IclR family transcriptional regulator